jgi:hypothetical protein
VLGAARPTRIGPIRLGVSWTASDAESGIASSQLQVRRDGGAWSNVALAEPTATRATVYVPAGHTYQFRVRAANGAVPSLTSAYRVSRIAAL